MALTDSLSSYWALDEASGDALDSHGSNDMTEGSDLIGTGTGKVYATARDFETATTTHYFTIASNSTIQTGGGNITVSGWFNLESYTVSTYRCICGKQASGQTEWYMYHDGSTNRLTFAVSNNGTAETYRVASTLGAISTSTWYFFAAWHDADNDTLGIRCGTGSTLGAADVTTSYTSGIHSGTAAFEIGLISGLNADNNAEWDGLLQSICFWKGRVLSSDEIVELFNGGDGLQYSSFSPAAAMPQHNPVKLFGNLCVPGYLIRP